MRMSDWSSDVCSSDLHLRDTAGHHAQSQRTQVQMSQRAQAQGREGGDQHRQHRADQGTSHERRRAAEELPVEMTTQSAADQPLTDLAATVGQADVQVPADRKSVVWGRSVSVRVDLGGRRTIKKNNKKK